MVERRLGRGLDFFLSGSKAQPAAPIPASPSPKDLPKVEEATTQAPEPTEESTLVEVGLLHPNPKQPRRTFDDGELKELADSIRANGILQPILARRSGGRLEVVAGERRLRAAKLAGLEKVPVLLRSITDEEAAVFALVENVQRTDLNAIEKAQAFKSLIGTLGVSQEALAQRVGLDRSTVANFIRLLDLPEEVQAHVSRGTLSMGHARALLGLSDPKDRVRIADEAIRKGLSVRELEAAIQAAAPGNQAVAAKPGAKKERPVWLNELEENLVESLGTPVTVQYSRKKSRIVIECAGREEFERVYTKLKNL